MTLVHAIGRILVCLFIVGGYGAGDIAQAAPPKEREIKAGIKIVKTVVGLVIDAFKPGRYLRAGAVLEAASNVEGSIKFKKLNREGSVTAKKAKPGVSIVSGYTTEFGGLEFDFSYRRNEIENFNKVDQSNSQPTMDAGQAESRSAKFDQLKSQTTVDGELETYSLMMNFVPELKWKSLESKGIIPYGLLGGGGSYVKYTEEKFLGSLGLKEGDNSKSMQHKGVFAYQAGGGVRWQLPFLPMFKTTAHVDVSYRFLGNTEIKFDLTKEGSERSFEFNNTRHTVMAGMTFVF